MWTPGIVKDKFLHTHDREDCVMEFEMGIAQVGKAHWEEKHSLYKISWNYFFKKYISIHKNLLNYKCYLLPPSLMSYIMYCTCNALYSV